MGSSYGYGILQSANKQTLPLAEQIYQAQREVIQKYADAGSCVIVGRCADYILRERRDVFNVFVYADMEKRLEHSVQAYGMSKETAREEIERSDRERARHYSAFTDREWGDRNNYDLMLNSGELSYENCAKTICSVVGMMS